VKAALAAILLAATAYFVWDWVRVDACLDRGGMWAGPMGCRTELPEVDRILIDKSDRKLVAFERGRVVATMKVALGRDPAGNKQVEGDNRTPEGIYPIEAHKPDSAFHRALRLGYPGARQQARAERGGYDPGSDIMIHGLPNGLGWIGSLQHRMDWTQGCIALTNGEVDWLYQSARDGTPVEIRA